MTPGPARPPGWLPSVWDHLRRGPAGDAPHDRASTLAMPGQVPHAGGPVQPGSSPVGGAFGSGVPVDPFAPPIGPAGTGGRQTGAPYAPPFPYAPPSPYAPPPVVRRKGRAGRWVAATVAGLVVLAGCAAVVAASGDDDDEFGASSSEDFFFAESASAAGEPDALGLELGTAVDVTDDLRDGEPPVTRLRLTPLARLRQTVAEPTPGSLPAEGGRYLVVDLRIEPVGGRATPLISDFTLLRADGLRLAEARGAAGLFDLFPSADGLDGPVEASLVFDLPVGEDVLLAYDGGGGTLATWRVPGGAAPVVDADTLVAERADVPD